MAIKIQNMCFQKLILVLGLMTINDWSPCSASLNLNNDNPETQHIDHKRTHEDEHDLSKKLKFYGAPLYGPLRDAANHHLEEQNQALTLSSQINQSSPSRDDGGITLESTDLVTTEFTARQYSLTTLAHVPIDSWRQIVSYLTSTTKLHHVSRYFFTLLTDYSPDHIQQRGFTNQFMLPHPSRLQIQGYQVDFDRIKEIGNYDIEAIPSYIWYSLTGTAVNMPLTHYDNLVGTRIHSFLYSRCTDDETYTLSYALQQTHIHTLGLKRENLVDKRVTEKGVQELVTLTNLTSLDIGYNMIREAGASAIAALINLTALNIEDNNIGYVGARSIASLTKLLSLNIRDNNIEESGASALTALTNLTCLNIAFNNIGCAGADSVTALTNLISLNIRGNVIGVAGAGAIAALTKITSLNIGVNRIGNVGISALTALTNLTSLDIGYNNIEEAGGRALASLTNLTTLDIGRNRIGAAGASIPAALTNLTALNIRGNHIGEAVKNDLRQKLNYTQVYF